MRSFNSMAKLVAISCAFLTYSSGAWAEASDKLWPVVKESFFAGKTIEPAPFIHLEGPRRAESGAQVPITLTIDKALTDADAIKNVYLIVDANPIKLAATYHFTPLSGKAQIATRIRMETDSFVRAIGETADGKLYMTAIEIRAAGGCGGAVDGDDTAIRAASGKIKLSAESPARFGEPNQATFLIKHPMFTGLQRDLASGGYKPAFYIQKVAFSYSGQPIMQVDVGVAIAEDPYMRLFYVPEGPGVLEVKADDNEGKSFTQTVDVKG